MCVCRSDRQTAEITHWTWAWILHTELFWAQLFFIVAMSWGTILTWFNALQMKKPWSICSRKWLIVWCIDCVSLKTLLCILPTVMRQASVSEINLITFCKCYNCFSNRPGLTLKTGINIHTHEPKTSRPAQYTKHFINYITFCVHCKSWPKYLSTMWPLWVDFQPPLPQTKEKLLFQFVLL